MTDPFNTYEDQDPQSLSRDYEAYADEFSNEEGFKTSQALYNQGLQYLSVLGYKLVRHPNAPFSFHYVYKLKEGHALPQLKGINYPASFKAYVPVLDEVDIGCFESHINDMGTISEALEKFWQPMIIPDPTKRKPLAVHSLKLLAADSERAKRDSNQLFELGISWDSSHKEPLKWLPKAEWFDEKIKQVTFGDIFTIFPPAEQEMLKLVIGRICVGRSHNLPAGLTDPKAAIKHTARMAALIVGDDPGLGKSQIFKRLWSALGKVGYTESTWNRPSDRFNMAEIVTSDIIYKDDVCSKGLREFLEHERTKIITTSGIIRTEEKGINAVNTACHGVLVLNANEVDPRLVYGLDPGILDRVHQLATYRAVELKNMALSGVSKNSPSVLPFNHIPWLAQKLEISEEALMLWACRLAADEFHRLVNVDPATGGNPLADKVKDVSHNLRYGFHKSVTAQVLLGLLFVEKFKDWGKSSLSGLKKAQDKYDGFPIPENWLRTQLDSSTFLKLANLTKIPQYGTTDGLENLREALKLNWESQNRPTMHPYMALLKINEQTLSQAAAVFAEKGAETKDRIEVLSQVFKVLALKNGFGLSYDRVWLTRAWETARLYSIEAFEMCLEIFSSWENDDLSYTEEIIKKFNQ